MLLTMHAKATWEMQQLLSYGMYLIIAECPRATYKRRPSPERCTACPDHSTTPNEGSTSIYECVCWEGYTGTPSQNMACTRR